MRKETQYFVKCDRLRIIDKDGKLVKLSYPVKIHFGNECIDGLIEFFRENVGQISLKIVEREP